MKNIIKTDFKRALKGAKFPLAIILMFFVWEFNSKDLLTVRMFCTFLCMYGDVQ